MKYIARLIAVILVCFTFSVNAQSEKDNQKLKPEVDSTKSKIAKTADSTEENVAAKIENLEEATINQKKKARDLKDDLNDEALDRLAKAERWYNESRENAEHNVDFAGDQLKKDWERTQKWFNRNSDLLKDGTKKRYNALKRRIDNY